jgi:hypothetical protein
MNFQDKNLQSGNGQSVQTLCLTPDQLADLLIAEDPNVLSLASRQRHLRQCAACQAEFHQLESALSGLRESARSGAGTAYGDVAPRMLVARREGLLPARPAAPKNRAVWALGVAAVALVVALPLTHRSSAGPSHGAAVATAGSPVTGTTMTDEALLDGVDQDISVSVPPSLQPLADPAGGNSTLSVPDDSSSPR